MVSLRASVAVMSVIAIAKRTYRSRPLLAKLCFAAAVLAAVGYLAAREIEDRRDAAAIAASAERAIRAAELTHRTDFHETLDAVRRFVHGNSVHRIDAEFYAHWGDPAYLLEQVVLHHEGRTSPPHMECSSRSGLMEIILRAMGYATRSVVVYAPDDGFPSHTFLEVHNPDSGIWEAQDPSYDLHWIAVGKGERIGVEQILSADLDAVMPCLSDEQCGWQVRETGGFEAQAIHDYFGLASIRDRARPLLVNHNRFGEARLHEFCDRIAKDCRGDIVSLPGH